MGRYVCVLGAERVKHSLALVFVSVDQRFRSHLLLTDEIIFSFDFELRMTGFGTVNPFVALATSVAKCFSDVMRRP